MKFEELINDTAFQAKFAAVTSPEEVVDLFAEYGVEVPLDIASELFVPVSESAELSDDELDSVAGGCPGGSIVYHFSYLFYRTLGGKSRKEARKAASDHAYGTFTDDHRHGWFIK